MPSSCEKISRLERAEHWLLIAKGTRIERIPWWQIRRRAFMRGRVAALRECAAVLQDDHTYSLTRPTKDGR